MLTSNRTLGLLVIATLFAAVPGASQIVAPAGRTLFNEGILIRSLVRYDSFAVAPGEAGVERFRSINALVWGARPHLSVSFVVPVVRLERSASPAGGPGVATTGTADASVFARYDLIRRTAPGGYTRLAPEIGLKLPTGGRFGSGSTDVIGGLVFSHIRDPNWWIAGVQATRPGTGDAGLRTGDRRRLDLAYLRRLLPRGGLGVPMVLGVLELNLEETDPSELHGVAAPNSGGEVLFISPGVEYVANRRVVLELSVPYALHTRFEGVQREPDFSVIVGARWLF